MLELLLAAGLILEASTAELLLAAGLVMCGLMAIAASFVAATVLGGLILAGQATNWPKMTMGSFAAVVLLWAVFAILLGSGPIAALISGCLFAFATIAVAKIVAAYSFAAGFSVFEFGAWCIIPR